MFNSYLSFKENSKLFTIDLNELKKETNFFYVVNDSKYNESNDNIEKINFKEFFKENYEYLKNFEFELDVLYITNAVENKTRQKKSNNSINDYNPFPKKIEVGQIDNLIVIKDIKFNYIAITDKSNIINTTF